MAIAQKTITRLGGVVLLGALFYVSSCFVTLDAREPHTVKKISLEKPKEEENYTYKRAKKRKFFPPGDVRRAKPTTDKLTIKRDNVELTFGLEGKIDGWFAKNTVLLNNRLPDEYGYYKQTQDITFDAIFGKESHGHPAFELFGDIRTKLIWGNAGRNAETTTTDVKLDDAVISKHSHLNDKAILWVRSLWGLLSLNAVLKKDSDDYYHYLKFGLFPFELGRGISLGTIYGDSREFLGLYTGYQNDEHAPGINLHGDIIKDRLSYDFYYAKLEEFSERLKQTFEHTKSMHVGRAKNPFRGVAKDNDLFAFRIKGVPLKSTRVGTLELEPYVLYNEASDRKIEFEADSKTSLGTYGLAAEYYYHSFEIGGEVAANFGRAKMRHIDRNQVKIVRDPDTGHLLEQYTHILDATGTESFKAPVTDENRKLVQLNKFTLQESDLGPNLQSAENRFRRPFEVKYRGWMTVVDAAYTFRDIDLKAAAAFGYASGDDNPFKEEKNRKFHGWIGLQEAYAGKRVFSTFVLDTRKMQRPTSLHAQDEDAGNDNAFTDLIFVGGGLTWFPIKHDIDKFSINPSALAYWKEDRSKKFDADLGQATNKPASKYLGTEFNIIAKYQLFENFQIFGNFAVFWPGGFYDDVKGTPLPDDVFNSLDLPDGTGVDSAKYRLRDDTAWLLNIGVVFKF